MRRCCICVFWDKNGIVRDYVTYYIKGLQEVCEKVYFAVNGEISEDGRKKLEELGAEIFVRENKGLDFGAWKTSVEKIGYEELSKYDELILTNTTCYGPIYPLSEMFDEMEKRDCDFWGITKHPATDNYMIPDDEKTKIIEHIQSYFTVFNKKIVLSEAFKTWWENIELFEDYKKVVGYYETKMTKYFEDAGFKSDSYTDTKLYDGYTDNPMFCTDKILEKMRLPLIKRKAIVNNYADLVNRQLTYQNRKVLDFIENNTEYNIDMIYNDIIATQPISEIHSNLHLNYILQSNNSFYGLKENQKTALILYTDVENSVEYCFNYLKSMPEDSDIYIVSPKENILNEYKIKTSDLTDYKFEYRLKENCKNDISAYLVACADVFENYDLVCCMSDKKYIKNQDMISQDFIYQCFECNLKSKDYVKNVIDIFNQNKRIGMLENPQMQFAFNLISKEQDILNNNDVVTKFYKELNLTVPFKDDVTDLFGSMFWIKSDAIKPLFRKEWKYEDFAEENSFNSYAIKFLYPVIVQEAGYLTGWIMPDDFARLYLDNLKYKADLLNEKIKLSKKKEKYTFAQRVFSLKNSPDKKYKIMTLLGVKIKIKKK